MRIARFSQRSGHSGRKVHQTGWLQVEHGVPKLAEDMDSRGISVAINAITFAAEDISVPVSGSDSVLAGATLASRQAFVKHGVKWTRTLWMQKVA